MEASVKPPFIATMKLRACLLHWQTELPRPFSLQEARKWAKDYLLTNGGNVDTVDKFVDFFLNMGYIRPVSGRNPRTQKFLIVSLLHEKGEHDLHAAIHSKQNNCAKTLLPLEACTLCARWLLSVGKNIQLSLQSIGGDASLKLAQDQKPPAQLLAYLDYLEKWPRCSVVHGDDENMNAVKHSLISAILTTLRDDVKSDPLDSNTISVIKFVLGHRVLVPVLRGLTDRSLREVCVKAPMPYNEPSLCCQGHGGKV
ncbi:unnamed protein product [Dibothriocephalus latus]|uniref:Uncharacterized protein n=1 Tax=Dibothriocephalus latus TaxID=60516 RepID=A0A3P7LK57_DIBLA|nr:unnamed protein product [Dibothriocephalus latus]